MSDDHRSTNQQSEVTRYLSALRDGDRSAQDKLMPLVYSELHDMAERAMRRERPDHTLQATALVNEAYVRLVDQKRVDWQGRAHFLAIAARTMRRILVDHARQRAALKRGAAQPRIEISEGVSGPGCLPDSELLALDEAMQELAGQSERQAKVVELRFFGGMNFEQIAAELGVSLRTAKGDWSFARAWLRNKLA